MELVHESPGGSPARVTERTGTLVRLTATGHEASLKCPYEQFMNKLESELCALGIEPGRAIELARVPEETFGADGGAEGPPIVSWIRDTNRDRFLLDLQAELTCFAGHFVGHPILPGVVQLHWAAILARSRCGFTDTPREVLRLKFRRIAVPPRLIELQIEYSEPSRVAFRLVSFQQAHAQGVLAFDGTA